MDKVNIRIFDKDINFVGEVDKYTSLFFIRKWSTYGEFEFHVEKMNNELFKLGNIIMINNDSKISGVIEHIEDNEEEHKNVIIKGFSLLYYLSEKITVPPVNYAYDTFNTQIENIITSLVNTNVINPVDELRKIPLLENKTSKGRGDKIHFQTRYKNLEEELFKLSKHSGLGLEIWLDYKNKKLIFEVLEGIDRSYTQQSMSPVYFSKKFDNIIKRNYIKSNIGYKNTAYVAGQGEGAERELVIVNNSNSGIDRRETFIDARDIAEGENISLEDRGKIKLSESNQIKTFECEVCSRGYRKDWDLGDIITITDPELNITVDYRIVEVKEIYEENGFKVETTFGTIIPTLIDKIKQINDTPVVDGFTSKVPGEPGKDGIGINYNWSGTSLGIKREDEFSYEYTNLQGPKGEQGIQGPIGPKGINGDKGDTGPQGQIGLTGPKGDTGTQGPQGLKGDKGDTGPQGPIGHRFTPSVDNNGNLSWTNNGGLSNPTTINIKGPKGDKGDTGLMGPQGPAGSTQSYIVFHEYFISNEGQTLFEWNDGYTYPLGINALSVYLNGVRLTGRIFEEVKCNAIRFKSGLMSGDRVFIEAMQMVTDLQGPKGDKGDTGATGPQGAVGLTGPKGDNGLTTSVTVNGTKYNHSNGNITIPDYVPLNEYWKIKSKTLVEKTDLDTVFEPGVYNAGSDGTSQTIINRPPGTQGFILYVFDMWQSGVSGRQIQYAIVRFSNEVYIRDKSEDTNWTTWKKISFDGDYNRLSNKPVIPNKTSQLSNDSGYITVDDLDTSQNHIHQNMSTLNVITDEKVRSWDMSSLPVSSIGNTGSTEINKFTKIATFEIGKQYGYFSGSFSVISGGHGDATTQNNILDIWIKCQAPIGQNGNMHLSIDKKSNLRPYFDFYCVEVSKSSDKNVYEIYCKNIASYTTGKLYLLGHESSNCNIIYHSNQPYITSLPTGNNVINSNISNQHTHTKSQVTDMPTKLSSFDNDVVVTSSTKPNGQISGRVWIQLI
ncbi:MAG: Gp37-like protein [Paraclostridium sp.]